MQALVLVADYANTTGDGKLNVLGIFNQILANSFPARHSLLYVIVQLRADIGERPVPRKLAVRLIDEDGNEIGAIGGQFQFPEGPGGATPTVNIVLPIPDVIFPKPGRYEFVALVDNNRIAERDLILAQIEPPEE